MADPLRGLPGRRAPRLGRDGADPRPAGRVPGARRGEAPRPSARRGNPARTPGVSRPARRRPLTAPIGTCGAAGPALWLGRRVTPASHGRNAPCASHSCPSVSSPCSPRAVRQPPAPTSPNGGYVPPPEHHQPPACCEPAPSFAAAPTPYDGVTFADPGTNPFVDPRIDDQVDLRARHRHGLLHGRPPLHRRRQPARSGERPGRGVRQLLRPGLRRARGRRLRDPRRRRPDPVPRRRRDRSSGSASRPATSPIDAQPAGGPDLRHRHVGLDGARGPPRARQAVAGAARRDARAATTRSAIVDLRHRRPRRARADAGPRQRGDPGRDRRRSSRAARRTLEAGLGSATSWPAAASSRGRHQPRRPRLGRRRQRRR